MFLFYSFQLYQMLFLWLFPVAASYPVASTRGKKRTRVSIRHALLILELQLCPLNVVVPSRVGPRPQCSQEVAPSLLFVRQSLPARLETRIPRTTPYRASQVVGSEVGRDVREREKAVSKSGGTSASTISC